MFQKLIDALDRMFFGQTIVTTTVTKVKRYIPIIPTNSISKKGPRIETNTFSPPEK